MMERMDRIPGILLVIMLALFLILILFIVWFIIESQYPYIKVLEIQEGEFLGHPKIDLVTKYYGLIPAQIIFCRAYAMVNGKKMDRSIGIDKFLGYDNIICFGDTVVFEHIWFPDTDSHDSLEFDFNKY